MNNKGLAIGIDLGATNIKGVLINQEGESVQQINHPIPIRQDMDETGGEVWKNEVKSTI